MPKQNTNATRPTLEERVRTIENHFQTGIAVATILGLSTLGLGTIFASAWSSVSTLKDTAKTTNREFEDLNRNIKTSNSYLTGLPRGAVVAWHHPDSAEVPQGWHECNGLDGTPDLRGLLIIGGNTGDIEQKVGSDQLPVLQVSGGISTAREAASDAHDSGGGKGTPQTTGLDHVHKLVDARTTAVSWTPLSMRMTYIMRMSKPTGAF